MLSLLSEIVISSQGFICAVVSEDWRPANARKLEEHLLKVYDLKTGQQRIAFTVLWDGGGNRVCFSRDGTHIYVGCYDVHGLACYEVNSGSEIWRRKDLKSVQHVAASPNKDLVFCGRETGASHVVEAGTGKTMLNPRGAKEVWFSPFDDHALVDLGKGREIEIHRPLGTRVGKFARQSFGIVSAAFSQVSVALAETGQSLRTIGLHDFRQIWQLPIDEAHTCRALAYSRHRDAFVVARKRDSQCQLQDVFRTTGVISARRSVNVCSGAFFSDADYFVDAQGTTYSVVSGKKLKETIF